MSIPYILNVLFSFYSLIMILRIFLTWIPNIDWESQPFKLLSSLVDPYLNLFRSFVPPMGGLDFSPIIAFFALSIIYKVLIYIVAVLGLV